MVLSTPKASDSFFDHGHFIHGIYPDRRFLAKDSALRPATPLKIASFDMDWTLIRTKTGNTFPKGKDDWLMLYDEDKPGDSKKKLRSLHEEGFQIVVFTNQAGVAIGRQNVSDLNHKFKEIHSHVGVPIIFLAATVSNKVTGTGAEMRKPQLGMWNYLLKSIYEVGEQDVDKVASFYCGDAAGRKQAGFDDFSCDDMVFSINLGLKFYTPEMMFKGDPLNFKPLTGVKLDVECQSDAVEEVREDAFLFPKTAFALLTLNCFHRKKRSDCGSQAVEMIKSIPQTIEQEMLIFVGSPGAGKSVLYQNYFSKDYLRINNDALK